MNKRVIILTGSTGTLGQEFISLYSSKYHIVGMARKGLKSNKYDFVRGDIAHDYEKLVSYTLERYGGIDVIINAAVNSKWNGLLGVKEEDILSQIKINALIPFRLSELVLRRYWQLVPIEENRKFKRNIINISSTAGIKYYNISQATYAVSKVVLNTLSEYMAKIFIDYGIRVNNILPNSFPSIISTTSVAKKIYELDKGNETGLQIIMDNDRN